jgi:hypothetical protein
MINVNQITSQLARMPDQALQQYAQMHKSDPYIMALALSESNRRKQMRSGAQMDAPEQPKVVDQEIQGMASPMPENVGIGQLPAGDMNFADGGIVAFGSGGDVPRYQSQGLVQGYSHGMVDPSGLFGLGPEATAYDQARIEEILARRKAAERAARIKFLETAAPETAKRMKQEGAATPDAIGRLSPGDMALRQQPVAAPPPAAPKPDAGDPRQRTLAGGPEFLGGPGPGAAPAAGLTAAAPNLDVSKIMSTALQGAAAAKHPYESELKGIGQERVAAKEAEVTGLEAIQKQFSDIYKGRKERLDTKEAELSKLKDQGMGLALLQAGAAMMTTPGGFGTALGRGVRVGTEQYAAGLDKLQAAKDKLSDARDRLEEIEAQRGELSARELFKARNAVKDTSIGAREDLVKANMQMYGLKREEALKLVEQQVKVGLSQFEQGEATRRSAFEQGEATKRTQITAGAQLGLLRAVANEPKLQAIYGKGQGQNKIMDEFNEFVKANPKYLTDESAALQAFLRTKGVLSSLGAASAAPGAGAAPGPVLPRKD